MVWQKELNQYCHDQKHGIMDIRNGILLDPRMRHYFYRYYFTIVRTEVAVENEVQAIFRIKTGKSSYPDDPEFANLDEKVLAFGNENDLWPHTVFLKWHNDRFDFAQEKAGNEPKRQDEDVTMIPNTHAFDDKLISKWLREHDNEPYEPLDINI